MYSAPIWAGPWYYLSYFNYHSRKMMAGKSLQSSELTLEEIPQVAPREIGSDVTKTAANMQFLRICSTQFDLHLG